MNKLSQTDNRVINLLRSGAQRASVISRKCFSGTNSRPALAHLHRMMERELVKKVGVSYWELTPSVKNPSPELPLDPP